jgi:type IV pilus assembly protein PilC
VFNTVFISLVHAGEQTGQLPLVFNELFFTLRWQNDLMTQAKKLLAYPIFVALVVLSTVTFLMTYLVPQMAAFLQNMGQSLPLNTRLLIALADKLAAYWGLLISLPILGLIAFSLLIQHSPVLQYRYDQLKLQLPITGPILQKIIMARFSRYFALMYQTGIPILDAIQISQGLVGNQVVANSLAQVHADISGGEAMSDSFNNAGLFPKLVVRMIKVGESTGGLDKSLFTISEFYDQEVRDAMQSLLKLIEPLLTVLLGSLLGFIMYSVLGPVYDSFSTLKI